GQVHTPGSVTVRPAANELAIQPNCGVGHGTIHIQENGFTRVLGRNAQLLPIPAHARTGQTAHSTATLGSEGALDRPVVRQVYLAPRAVVIARLRIRDAVSRISTGPDES